MLAKNKIDIFYLTYNKAYFWLKIMDENNDIKKVFSKTEIDELPKFKGLPLNNIIVINSSQKLEEEFIKLKNNTVLGFDTESKPVFKKGQKSKGPHIIQFASNNKAFLIQVDCLKSKQFLIDILNSKSILKVGFNLTDDLKFIKKKLKTNIYNYIDLQDYFKHLGSSNIVGLKQAVARSLGLKIQKSKSVTTTNWALPKLSDSQKKYAADDAYGALAVYNKLLKIDENTILKCLK